MLELRCIIVLLLLSAHLGVVGQDPLYSVSPLPDWVVAHELDASAPLASDCVQGGEELLLLDRQYHLGRKAMYWRRAVRMTTSQAVQNGSRFEMAFDPSYQKLVVHHLRVIRDGKVLDKFDKAKARILRRETDMHSFLYDGTYTLVMEMADIRPGDIVDEAVSFIGWNPVDEGRFHRQLGMGFSIPVGRNHLRVVVPNGRTLQFATHGNVPSREVEVTREGQIWTWDQRNQHCVQPDRGLPGWYDAYPWVEFSEFNDVEMLRSWALKQYSGPHVLGTALQARLAQLRQLPSDADRLDSAIALVQREVRYLGLEEGIGAYRPHKPSQVFDQKFGDCKDKSLLLATILDALGIPAYPALVNTVSGQAIAAWLPRPSQFDHCITMVPNGGDTLWVDGTAAYNGGIGKSRYIADHGQALVVAKDASGYARMNVYNKGDVDITETIVLDSLGGAGDLRILSEFRGSRADAARADLAARSLAEITKTYTDYYTGVYGTCELVEPVRWTDDRQTNILKIHEHYRMLQPWDTLDEGTKWRFDISATYIKDFLADPGRTIRSGPFAMGEPVEVRHLFHVTLPLKWDVSEYQASHAEHGITFERNITVDQTGVVSLDHRYSSTHPYVEADQAHALHDLQTRIGNDLYFEFTHPRGEVATVEETTDRSVWMFVALCVALAFFGARYLYEHDPAPDPLAFGRPSRSIGGFLFLPAFGLVYSLFRILVDMSHDDAWFFKMTGSDWATNTPHPLLAEVYTHLSQVHGIALLAFVLLLLVLFFKRRTSAPLFLMVFYGWNLAWCVLDMLFYQVLDISAITGESYGTKDVARAFIAALIWIPVFSQSERVKTTFTVRRDGYAPDMVGEPAAPLENPGDPRP